MVKYTITCNCGQEVSGNSRRETEAKMWHHAVRDHAEMVQGMSTKQFEDIMKSWDEKFDTIDKSD